MSRSTLQAEELKRLITYHQIRDSVINTGLDTETREKILRRARVVGHEVYYYRKADRLMPLAGQAILRADSNGTDLPSGCVWWADSLVQARGRIGRSWWAPTGGVYLCLALYPSLFTENWSFYNLGVGVAVAQVLREKGVSAKIRWINDVLIKGRKMAGILTEAVRAPNSGQAYLLFGIGINANMETFPEDLAFATSLSITTGKHWHTKELAARILARIGWIFGLIHQWESDCLNTEPGYLPQNPVIRDWNLLSDTPGRRVIYGLNAELNPEFEALAQGLAPDGSLMLTLDNGEGVRVNSGEIRYI
ncbi:MAG: biotin--[acetyl-CoA-carboxylase] ligase [Thermodesulfobacteriota bacterium]|nr:MAG: biotin--[acetyl-CoA-carboxylase] ligase [Thermodesulfobacteriota bacterium]